MSVIGIVCEFNPFHNGHKYLIDAVRNDGDTVVCCMSGNFTQRAEPAMFEKSLRTEVALRCGADIVLELPFVYATATAEIFAKNAIRILCEFGCEKIAFGVENDNKDVIFESAKLLGSDAFKNEVEDELDDNHSYPVARQRAFSKHGIDYDLSEPNNILAIEYVKAILEDYPSADILPVKRIGVEHDSQKPQGSIASASFLRNYFDFSDISQYVPEIANELYRKADREDFVFDSFFYTRSLLTLLRAKLYDKSDDFAYLNSELDSRIQSAVRKYYDTGSLDGLFDAIKTRRYTASRVRRAVLYKAFGVGSEFLKISAPYIRILGFKSGCENIIIRAKERSEIPIVSAYREIKALNDEDVLKVFEFESKTTDIYNLSITEPKACGTEMTRQIIII